jgi:hypothetical protein
MMPINPLKVYEVNGEPCPLKTAFGVFGVANNQLVVTAVTGKKIRIMGVSAQCGTGTGAGLVFKNGSGGSVMLGGYPPHQVLGLFWQEPVIDPGYSDTTVSTGLYADVTGFGCTFNLYYIEYTPEA